jgi:C4-type Zn-finger protein
MKAPICQKCGKYCNPSGGTVDNRIKYWTCFNCGYKVEDVPYLEVKQNNIQ